jgi:peptide-methionine (S)-S-oxide reductase
MKHTRLLVLAAAWLAGAIFLLPGIEQAGADFPDPPSVTDAGKEAGLKTAVLAGGCFWGIEGIFESLKGVQAVVAGYSGGKKETADYAAIGTGTTGHAESVQIRYDTALVSFGTLLKPC